MNFTRWFAQFTSVRRFFLIALSLAELFAFTGIAHSASSIDDNFAGNALDWCRWEDVSYNGTVTQSGELSLSPSGTQQWTNAGIVSQMPTLSVRRPAMISSTASAIPAPSAPHSASSNGLAIPSQ